MSGLDGARRMIDLDGEDAYASAARLVGADKADELMAEKVRNNMAEEGHTPKEGEVEGIVAGVRRRKGY